MDRTSEFLSIAQALPTTRYNNINNNSSSSSSSSFVNHTISNSSHANTLHSQSQNYNNSNHKDHSNPSNTAAVDTDPLRYFHATAGDISRDIAETSVLLGELTQLVRRSTSSLFLSAGYGNDINYPTANSANNANARHMNSLVVRIKSNIENLNARLDQLSNEILLPLHKKKNSRSLFFGSSGSSSSSSSNGSHHHAATDFSSSQAAQLAANVVDGLKTEFAQTASGFKQILQQRTDSLKDTEDRQWQVYGGGRSGQQSHQHRRPPRSSNGTNNDEDDDDPIPNLSSILAAPPPVYTNHHHRSSLVGPATATMTTAPFPTLDLTSSLMPAGEPTSSSVEVQSLPRPHGMSSSNSNIMNHHTGLALTPANAYAGGYGFQPSAMNHPHHFRGVSSSNNSSSMGVPLTPLDIARMEEESGASQLMQLIPDQTSYVRQRADAMSHVESNIVELGTIFNKLASMVQEHGELVQRVEDNVEDANENITMSLNALTDTLTSLRTNKWLALKVFSILAVFIIFFIIFAA